MGLYWYGLVIERWSPRRHLGRHITVCLHCDRVRNRVVDLQTLLMTGFEVQLHDQTRSGYHPKFGPNSSDQIDTPPGGSPS